MFRVHGTAPTGTFLGRMKYLYQRIRERTFLACSGHWDKAVTHRHPITPLLARTHLLTVAGQSL